MEKLQTLTKSRRRYAVFAAAALLAVSCPNTLYADGDTVTSYLTGQQVSADQGRRRPVSFMIDNVSDSVPQSGIGSADIYYECEVETDLSRICAVFENYDSLDKIGPLRSCRDYFISLTAGLDVIYEHYGQAAYALPYLESDEVDNISAMMSYATEFYRDGPHEAPHNAYVSGYGMNAMIAEVGYDEAYPDDFSPMYQFACDGEEVTNDGGSAAAYVEIGYPFNKPHFEYNEETGLYYRWQYGDWQIDYETDEVLSVKNIILEYENGTVYQDSSYLHYETTGSGRGKYITDGKAVDITWERDDFYSPVIYRLEDGTELTLNQGKTWVSVIRNNQIDQCLIGSSEDKLSCVIPEDEVSAVMAEAEEWIAEYKAGENEYLTGMAQIRTENLEKHGGETKVEPNLP